MPKICDICGKGYQKGNQVPRGIGNRVTSRTIKKSQPNIRSKRISLGTSSVKIYMCASCLKRIKFESKADAKVTVESKVDTAN